MPVRILLADDHEVVRKGLRALLPTENSDWKICGEAVNGDDAVKKARRLKPDLIIMDITMPEMDGLEATREILKEQPEMEVIILTVHDSQQMLARVLASGARGCVLKSDVARDLVNAIKTVSQHKPFLSSGVSEVVLKDYHLRGTGQPSEEVRAKYRLTPREQDLLTAIARGKSTKEAAASLGISTKTAETHRINLMRKLDVHSTGELVSYAFRNKLVPS
jgi:DNA-binding NarL/FixJ family response regulator